jgi:hypothetical protein
MLNTRKPIVIIKRSVLLAAALFSMLLLLMPAPLVAKTIIVLQDPTQCPADTVTNPCYTNLNDAIANSTTLAGDSIEIRPGTYVGNFILNKSVSIYGNETAATILSGNGSSQVLTVDGVTTAMSIKRLTFVSATTGILLNNSNSVNIANNVFQSSITGAAVQLTSTPVANVINNTFYRNATGISSNTFAINITNNIFDLASTGVAISPSNMDLTSIQNNLIFGGTIGPPVITNEADPTWKGNINTPEPSFVNPNSATFTENDFHLKTGSPCINAGSTAFGLNTIGDTAQTDMGAYGATTDTIPFPVSGVNPSTSASGIFLSWRPNLSYLVAGYRVYYGSAPGDRAGTGATEGNSGFNVTTASVTVSGLTATVATPGTPSLSPPEPRNGSLVLNWSTVPSAKSYNVYFGTTSPPTTLAATVDAPSVSYTLTGLTNGQLYYVTVSAVNQAIYYLTITAFDSAGTTTGPSVAPGVAHESDYSPEVQAKLGNPAEGLPSNIVSGIPEVLTVYPALPNGHQGCFIATAAYGHYSDPEVQALREFRDQYLLTNSLGRAFVEWYYRVSPAAAAALNAHPAFKPVIRAALLPAVGGACLLTRTSLLFKIILLLVFGCAVLFLYNRKRLSRFGGDC